MNRVSSHISLAKLERCRRGDGEKTGACRRHRLILIGIVACFWVVGLVFRLFSLQISDVERWKEWARKQHVTEVKVASERGPITDRNGKMMAVSVPASSVFVHPHLIKDVVNVAHVLAPILNESPKVLQKKLASDKPFVWLARQIPRFEADQITGLKLPGVNIVLEARRFYPYNQAASAVLGKVGMDGAGLSGVELVYENNLHRGQVTTTAHRDALGNVIQPASLDSTSEKFAPPRGDALELTLDADLQIIVDEELEEGLKTSKAKQAMAVMIDSSSGEILALSQAPSFNFNFPQAQVTQGLRSVLVETVYEPGSVMKPLVTAAAIEEKIVRDTDLINCENGRFSYGKHTIKDVHPSGTISVHDVVVRSSNIGMTKIGDRLGPDRLYRYLRELGFGQSTDLGLPGESRGILRPVSKWSKVDVATHSFGQGIAVTPLQIVRATAALANGGILPPLRLVQGGHAEVPRRIFSPKTAALVKSMMIDVVEDKHGTGGNAKIPGVIVGGKTGTAQKASPNGRGYQAGSYVASFVGFVERTDPTPEDRGFVLMVAIDEPHTGTIYGGTLAAPVFKRIVERTLAFTDNRRRLNNSQGVRAPRILDSEIPQVQQVLFDGRKN